MTLDDSHILDLLRSGGPLTEAELTAEVNVLAAAGLLEGVKGLVGISAVLKSLRRLRAAGRAVEVDGKWEWRPERVEKVSGRTVQSTLF